MTKKYVENMRINNHQEYIYGEYEDKCKIYDSENVNNGGIE